jgi:hypothetical protein
VIIEFLYFDGCPNHEPVLARLPRLLESAGVSAQIELQRVESDEDAQRQRFLGSPTVRVEGRDIEPGAQEREDFGLKCRLYRTEEGLIGTPPDEWILGALRVDATTTQRASGAATLLADRSAEARLADCPRAYKELHQRVLRSFIAGEVPRATDLERWAADVALDELQAHDLVWRDPATGDVTTAYPFSAVPTVHTVRLAGSESAVFSMCAVDALGIPFMAERAGEIVSRDGASGAPVRVWVEPDGEVRSDPADVVVVAGLAGRGRAQAAAART